MIFRFLLLLVATTFAGTDFSVTGNLKVVGTTRLIDTLKVDNFAGTGTRMVVADATGRTSTQTIPAGGSLANPTSTIGLSIVNGTLTSAMRSDGAPALSQAIVPTWTGKHTFQDTVAGELGFRAGATALSNVNLYRSAANMWKTDDSLTIVGNLIASQLAGSGTRMVVADPNGVTSTQTIPVAGSLANPTGTIGLSVVNGSATSGMRSDGAPALSQAIVPTWTGKHTFQDTVAGELGFRAGATALSNVNLYRSAANMWKTDDSLTIVGNLIASQLAGSGTRMVVADPNGVTSTQTIPVAGSLANPTGTIGLSVVNGSATSGMRSDGAPALSQAIVPTWTGKHTFQDTVAGELGFRAGATALSNVNLYRSAANMWKTDDSLTIVGNLIASQLAGSGTRMVVADPNGVTSTQTIPVAGSLANPTGTIGLSVVNGSATSGMRSDGAPALSQAIVPTWTGKHTFQDTVAGELGFRAGATALSNVNLYRSAANMWKTDDSITVSGKVANLQTDWTYAGGPTWSAGTLPGSSPSYDWGIADTNVISFGRYVFRIAKSSSTHFTTLSSKTFTVVDTATGTDVVSTVQNTTNASASGAGFHATTGSTAGPAYTQWTAHGGDWNAGVPGDASHSWKLSQSDAGILDTNATAISVDTNLIMQHRGTAPRIERLTDAGNYVGVDANLSDFFTVTLTADDTLYILHGSPGRHLTLRVKEDGSGGHEIFFHSSNTWRFPSGIGPVQPLGANAISYYSFAYDEEDDAWDFVGNALNMQVSP